MIAKWFNRTADIIAAILFPWRNHTWIMIGVYTIAAGLFMVWLTGQWMWIVAMVLCMAFAVMVVEWYL